MPAVTYQIVAGSFMDPTSLDTMVVICLHDISIEVFELGKCVKKPVKVVPPPPPPPADTDGDGVNDNVDACPTSCRSKSIERLSR